MNTNSTRLGGLVLHPGARTPYAIHASLKLVALLLGLLIALPSALAQTETVLYHFDSHPGDGLNPSSGLVMDKAGNFYGSTQFGGAYGYGTVYKLTAKGKKTTLHSFNPATGDGSYPGGGLALDQNGNIFGTCPSLVFKLTPTGAETVLHIFNPASGYVTYGGPIVDKNGNIYGMTDYGGPYGVGSVYKLSPTGTETVLYSFNPANGDGNGHVDPLVMDSDGNLYGISNSGGPYFGGQVFKLTPAGTETILHNFGSPGDGVTPAGALILDKNGNLYGTTSLGGYLVFNRGAGGGTIFKITPQGDESLVYLFGNHPEDGLSPSGGVVMDPSGNLYATTIGGGTNLFGTVVKVTPAGNETVLYSFSGSPNGMFPVQGVTRDMAGNLYGTTRLGGESVGGDGIVFKVVP